MKRQIVSDVGCRIRHTRSIQGMTQAELGKLVDLPPDRIQKYESGTRTPKVELISKIAEALDVPIDCFLEYDLSDPVRLIHLIYELTKLYNLDFYMKDNKVVIKSKDCLIDEFASYLESYISKKIDLDIALEDTTRENEKIRLLNEFEKWIYKNEFTKRDADTEKEMIKSAIRELNQKEEALKKILNDLEAEE